MSLDTDCSSGFPRGLSVMAEPTIYAQAHYYLEDKLSFPELREWLYERIWDYFEDAPVDQPPNSDLYSWMFGLFCDYDLDVDIFGGVAEAEAAFRRSLAAYLRTEAQTSPAVAVSVSSQSS